MVNVIHLSAAALVAASQVLSAAGFVSAPLFASNAVLDRRGVVRSMGFFDDLRLIFSEEGKKNRAEYAEREEAEMMEAQRQIMERRSNPAKMEAYEAEVASRRRALEEDEAVWDFQTKVAEGYDPLTDWTRLREEGKITVGSEMERDKDSERLGSEGLVEVRTDTLLPYVDQGYVDENAVNFMDIFKGKKKEAEKEAEIEKEPEKEDEGE